MNGGEAFSGESSTAEMQSRGRRRGRRRENCKISYDCLSPRSLLFRWFPSAKKSKGLKVLEVRIEKVEIESRREGLGGEAGGERDVEVGCSMKGLTGDCEAAEVSEQCRKEDCFNLAVGFGLFYLIAASKNELDKMMKLRMEMEMLIRNVKEDFQNRRREIISKPSDSNDILACSTTDAQESLCSNVHVSLQDLLFEKLLDSETAEFCDQSPTCKATRQEKCMEGIDHLEAELEAELERLQLHLDTGDTFEHPKQQGMEGTVGDTPCGLNKSFGEVVDSPELADTIEHFGVPPNELERRLHELLESRQQERIKELEAALECANCKLCEKEREVCWWKDTAQLVSQQVPNTSR